MHIAYYVQKCKNKQKNLQLSAYLKMQNKPFTICLNNTKMQKQGGFKDETCLISRFSPEKSTKKRPPFGGLCDPAGTRTQDPYIKSVLLYQLSYGILCVIAMCYRFNRVQK